MVAKHSTYLVESLCASHSFLSARSLSHSAFTFRRACGRSMLSPPTHTHTQLPSHTSLSPQPGASCKSPAGAAALAEDPTLSVNGGSQRCFRQTKDLCAAISHQPLVPAQATARPTTRFFCKASCSTVRAAAPKGRKREEGTSGEASRWVGESTGANVGAADRGAQSTVLARMGSGSCCSAGLFPLWGIGGAGRFAGGSKSGHDRSHGGPRRFSLPATTVRRGVVLGVLCSHQAEHRTQTR